VVHMFTSVTPQTRASKGAPQKAVGSQVLHEFWALSRLYSLNVLAVAQNEMREMGVAPTGSNFKGARKQES
jgi:hypothetical protein